MHGQSQTLNYFTGYLQRDSNQLLQKTGLGLAHLSRAFSSFLKLQRYKSTVACGRLCDDFLPHPTSLHRSSKRRNPPSPQPIRQTLFILCGFGLRESMSLVSRNSKRKSEEYLAGQDFRDFLRMSKAQRNVDYVCDREGNVFDCNQYEDCGSRVLSSERCTLKSCDVPGGMLQFFVKLINGKSILVRTSRWNTVGRVIEEVARRSGIPVREQRVIYGGKQLDDESVLNECGICNDCVLQIVARMKSSACLRLWRQVEGIKRFMRRICNSKGNDYERVESLKVHIGVMFAQLSDYNDEDFHGNVMLLIHSNFPAELMKVYLSVESKYQHCVSECIKQIIAACLSESKPDGASFYPLILEFAKMLSMVGYENQLYLYCRQALAQMVCDYSTSMVVIGSLLDIIPFLRRTYEKISGDMVVQSHDHDVDSSLDDIRDFGRFFKLLKHVLEEHYGCQGCGLLPIPYAGASHPDAIQWKVFLYTVYLDLLTKINVGLQIMENDVTPSIKESRICHRACQRYLPILKVLYDISKLYSELEDNYRKIIGSRKNGLSQLILTFSSRSEYPFWLFELKDFLDFKAKRHLVLLLFPDVKYDFYEMNELLIDRSNLLAESFEYMKNADRNTLHSNLFVEFKNEEATGPGVLREWFIMVCRAIFYTGNPLFTACPNDRRRFFLNPASTVDPLHPDYLRFCGRVIALALRHKVQLGIVFDRVFFMQLAGIPITLEDIKEADPEFYRSCKHILDMDAEFVDTDALGLTFAREVEEMGSRKVVELCHDGKNKVVNSHNRGEYVELLVFNRFVASTSAQLLYFSQGFGDILTDSSQTTYFFKNLDLEDLDLLLQGSSADIPVEDWKTHTVYTGYKETDSQIAWFWKIVSEMSAEQRRVLLFFWTSVKYLPPEGFHGLSCLNLSKVQVPHDRLPTSQTCFHRLYLPEYSSLNTMRIRLNVITQEHVGLSFGSY